MPRPHWKNASPIVQRTIRGWLTDDRPPADAWIDAAATARSFGFDFDPPSTPKLQQLDDIKETLAVAEFRRANALTLAAESRALAFWKSTRAWAATDPARLAKPVEAERKRRAAELDAMVQNRATELRQLQHTLLPADALEQARKELGHVSP